MKVHQVINSFSNQRGGAERIARALHNGLRKRGIDARLVALEECDASGLSCAQSFHLNSAYDPRVLVRLSGYMRAHVEPGDIIHAHLFPTSAYVATLRLFGVMRGLCAFTEHSTWNRRRASLLGRLVDRLTYSQFDRVIAISEGAASELATARPFLRSRLEVVLNGADLHFETLPHRAAKAIPTILAIGRLTPAKNYGALLDALARMPGGSFRCTILGDGPLRQTLEARRSALGLEGDVTFAGHVEDVRSYLEDADIFAIPSLWEGFGLAAVEALNAGLPVVASDVAGLREIVGLDGRCARLIDPKDPKTIETALRGLIGDPELRKEMGAQGFRRSSQFSTAKMVDEYQTQYETLSGGSLARAS